LNYLRVENARVSFGEKILFDNIALSVNKGDKIALVAKNGSGKTSLLRLINQEIAPEGEQATLLMRSDIRVAYLEQDPHLHPNLSVLDEALDSDNEKLKTIKAYESALYHHDETVLSPLLEKMEDLKAWDVEAKVKEILGKLGIYDYDQKVGTLSGGQLKRLALAKILISEPDFLILDEPTNHLDLDMIEWLEKYLQAPNLSLLMVTHDRYFLERVCNVILELENATLFTHRGNYSEYLENKSSRRATEITNSEKLEKLYKKELDWVRRQPKARTTKAKSRVDKFDQIKEDSQNKIVDEKLELSVVPERLGSKILEAHNLSKSFGELKILENFDYKFKKGEKVGVVGPNGIGKSSFIKLLMKELASDSGKVVIGETVKFGHYSQDGLQLKNDKRIIDIVRDIAEYIPLEKGNKLTAASLLERFLFPRWQQQVYYSQLSGGEKRRLHLLTILMNNPNFLILDEPTNDLDILTLSILEEYLSDFSGCVLVISHDRFFMDRIVDHLFIFQGAGRIKDYNGNYSTYRMNKAEIDKASGISNQTEVFEKPEQSIQAPKTKMSYLEKREMEKLEKDMEALEKEKSSINKSFLSPDLESDEIQRLSLRLGELMKSMEEMEERWLELADKSG
jgi:ATP-binding cassette subfamily F protein uup